MSFMLAREPVRDTLGVGRAALIHGANSSLRSRNRKRRRVSRPGQHQASHQANANSKPTGNPIMSKGVQIAIGATAIAALFGWYGAATLEANASFTYYESLDDFQSAGSKMDGAHARVHGYVANESIRRDVAAQEVWFEVQNDPPHAGGTPGRTLEVVLASLETPDLFKDGAEVVLEGVLVSNGSQNTFEANKILAKCPSKFEAKAAESAKL